MQMLVDQTKKFIKAEDASAGAEYALLVSLIAVAIVAGVSALGITLSNYYNSLAAGIPDGG
jgi:Flp pilus assembly pilin Flp